MKVKLLEPIEGYEDVAEWREPADGEYYLGPCGTATLSVGPTCRGGVWPVLTPKPLPVVEPPKPLGCVKNSFMGSIYIVLSVEKPYLHLQNLKGEASFWPLCDVTRSLELYRTANIPTDPALEALFKE